MIDPWKISSMELTSVTINDQKASQEFELQLDGEAREVELSGQTMEITLCGINFDIQPFEATFCSDTGESIIMAFE